MLRTLECLIGVTIIAVVAIFTCQQIGLFYQNGALSSSGYVFTAFGVGISLAGVAAAVVVPFEGLLFPVARYCFKTHQWAGAFVLSLLLCTALFYTATVDFEANVTGREDRSAQRAAAVDSRVDAKSEIERLNKIRGTWAAMLTTTRNKTTIEELSDKIDDANKQIAKLREDMSLAPVTAGATPTAKLLHDNLGYAEATWAFIIVGIKLIFPMLMRAFGLAVAIYAFEMIVWSKLQASILSVVPKPVTATVEKPTPITVERPKPTPDALPEKQLQAAAGTKKQVLPFRLVDASRQRLASLDDVVASVMSSKPYGRHYFADLLKEVEHVCEDNFLPKPHDPVVGGKIAALLGVSKGSRDGSRGNATFYTIKKKKRSNHRAQDRHYPRSGGGRLLEVA